MANHGLNMDAPRRAPCYLACILVFLAVTSCQGQDFADFRAYMAEWQNSPFSQKLYPFGSQFFDARYIQGGEITMEWSPTNVIPFLGGQYMQIHVSTSGYIRFSASQFTMEDEKDLPYAGTINQHDPTLIAAFFASSFLRYRGPEEGGFYLRLIDQINGPNEDLAHHEISVDMLEYLGQEVRENVMGAYDFQPTYAVVATWANVTLLGCFSDGCPNNTFQAVFLTDLHRSFAILNYLSLEWLNSVLQGCDGNTGMGSGCRPAQLGFNAGHGIHFHPIPYSGQNELLTQVPAIGRFIYDVSGEVPLHGGCLSSQNTDTNWEPQVYPPSGSMLGGYQIHISGRCLNPATDMVKCRFGSNSADLHDGMVVDENRVACQVPFLAEIGNIPVYVKVNDQDFMTAHFLVENPDQAVHRIKLVQESQWYHEDATQLDMRWEPRELYWPAGRGDEPVGNSQMLPENLRVRIDLYGIRERQNIESARTAGEMYELMHLETLSEYQTNNGFYGITLDGGNVITCQVMEGKDCDWFVGMVRVTLDLGNAENNRGNMNNTNTLWTKPVPLMWYVKQSMETDHGMDWPAVKCKLWADSEPEDTTWTQDLDVCPCTYQQAYTTSGQFIVGAECEEGEPCPMQQSKYCIIQTMPSSQGGASTCCYDAANSLLYAGDKSVGDMYIDRSYSRRRYPQGVAPYNDYRRTPTLSYWFHDKLAMILCCLMSGPDSDSCMFLYAPHRPTLSCSSYEETGIAMAYGDPHYSTFDNHTYTFNGAGEFWLVKAQDGADTFNLQARMVQPEDDAGNAYSATVITAVAMQETYGGQTGPKVQVQFTGDLDNVPNDLVVYVDGMYRTLVAGPDMWYRFSGTGANSDRSVIIVSNYDSTMLKNLTVIFDSGVAVGVASSNSRLLHVTTKIPHKYFDKTSGLMGKWNHDPTDDLTPSGGSPLGTESSNEQIHNNFGKTWAVTSGTVFTYFGTQTAEAYSNPNFVPSYEYDPSMLTGTSITTVSLVETCGRDERSPCYFDYAVMLDNGVAAATRQAESWSHEMHNMSQIVPICGEVSAPHCIKVVTNYLENGEMKIEGAEEGYKISGHTTYRCAFVAGHLRWEPTPNTECTAAAGASNATAIAVTIVVILLIIVILVLLFVWYRRRNKSPNDEEVKPKPVAQTHQEPHQPRHLSQYPDPYINEGLSQSTSSVGSVVLTEELHSARPPRPKKEKRPKPEMNGMQQYDNRAADVPQDQQGIPPSQPRYANVPPADRSTPEPNLPPQDHHYPQTPTQGYENPVMQEPESPRVPQNRYPMPQVPHQYASPGRGVDTSV